LSNNESILREHRDRYEILKHIEFEHRSQDCHHITKWSSTGYHQGISSEHICWIEKYWLSPMWSKLFFPRPIARTWKRYRADRNIKE
jgi:hypothetical protein